MNTLYRKLLVPACTLAALCSSCSNDQVDDFFRKYVQAPESSIERDVKGHDQIYAVHIILRMGYKGGRIGVGPDGTDSIPSYITYQTVGEQGSIPIMQEIDIAKDDEGQMTVTTERDHFDVLVAPDIYYGLELKYYDQNGMLINHQFSGYPFKKDADGSPIADEENATLMVHQHFFTIGNTSLNQSYKLANGNEKSVKGLQLAYPRTLEDKPHYIDRYTFRESGSSAERASKFSNYNLFAPQDYAFGKDAVPFDEDLTWKAIELSGKPEALSAYKGKDGKDLYLYKAIDNHQLNQRTPELFTYEYRDTDPVEEELGKTFTEAYVDDFIDPDEDAPRQRYGHTVGLLRQYRSLDPGGALDRLGFKGMLQFHKANIQFQLQVRICHILNKAVQQAGETERPAKYTNKENVNNGFLWEFNQLQQGWDSFDIDYPIPIRVLADSKDGEEKCYESVKRFYPQMSKAKLWQLLTRPQEYLYPYRHNAVTM